MEKNITHALINRLMLKVINWLFGKFDKFWYMNTSHICLPILLINIPYLLLFLSTSSSSSHFTDHKPQPSFQIRHYLLPPLTPPQTTHTSTTETLISSHIKTSSHHLKNTSSLNQSSTTVIDSITAVKPISFPTKQPSK